MRRASQVPAGVVASQPTAMTNTGAVSSRRETVKKFGTHTEWLQSMGLDQVAVRSPRPPPPRLHTPQRPGGSKTPDADAVVPSSPGTQRRGPKRRLKRFLPTLDRPVHATTITDGAGAELHVSSVVSDSNASTADVPANAHASYRRRSRALSSRVRTISARSSNASAFAQENMTLDERAHAVDVLDRNESTESAGSGRDSGSSASGSEWSESESETSDTGNAASDPSDTELKTAGDCSDALTTRRGTESAASLDPKDAIHEGESPIVTTTERKDASEPQHSYAQAPHRHRTSFHEQTSRHSRVESKKRRVKVRFAIREQEDERIHTDSESDTAAAAGSSRGNDGHADLHARPRRSRISKALRSRATGLDDTDGERGDFASEEERRESERTPSRKHKDTRKSRAHQAEFQRLMMQYLGLLQCQPAAVVPSSER